MSHLIDKIASMDVTVFDPIETQTSKDDRISLLSLQKSVREKGKYAYLEIGSYLGGTIQTHYIDPQCEIVYSVDPRPRAQPDERGTFFFYDDNSFERMMQNLSIAYPEKSTKRVVNFSCNSSDVDLQMIETKPTLAFIDGEHTNKTVIKDFEFCLKACHKDPIIAFHDSGFIFEAILEIKSTLERRRIRHMGLKLKGSVYALLLNDAIDIHGESLALLSEDEAAYFESSKKSLADIRNTNRNIKNRIIRGIIYNISPSLYDMILRVMDKTLSPRRRCIQRR